jgi:hypothetical protein
MLPAAGRTSSHHTKSAGCGALAVAIVIGARPATALLTSQEPSKNPLPGRSVLSASLPPSNRAIFRPIN